MTNRWTAFHVVALVAALVALLAACGGGTQGAIGEHVGSAAPARPTVTNATVAPSHRSASCKDPAALVSGDLRVSPTALADGRPTMQAPDSAPLKPLALPVQGTNGHAPTTIPGWFAPAYDSPPDLLITICNTSTKSHVIESVSVKLGAFIPHSGSLNIWNPCAGTYARPTGVVPLECGETAAIWDETVRANFAANAQVGAIAPASLDDSAFVGDLGPLPVSLPPGRDMQIGIFVAAPAAAGVYTFAAGVTADKAPLLFTAGQNMLLAPIGHHWTGKACLPPAMQAGIPANSPAETYYICPES
jgi:hypothetical protein